MSQVSQQRKDKYRTIPPSGGPWSSRIHRARKEKGGRRGAGEGDSGEFMLNGHRVSVWKDENALQTDGWHGGKTM